MKIPLWVKASAIVFAIGLALDILWKDGTGTTFIALTALAAAFQALLRHEVDH